MAESIGAHAVLEVDDDAAIEEIDDAAMEMLEEDEIDGFHEFQADDYRHYYRLGNGEIGVHLYAAQMVECGTSEELTATRHRHDMPPLRASPTFARFSISGLRNR